MQDFIIIAFCHGSTQSKEAHSQYPGNFDCLSKSARAREKKIKKISSEKIFVNICSFFVGVITGIEILIY